MSTQRYKLGYCAVTADFLHIGHVKFLKRCKSMCTHLTVGVMTDDCVKGYKKHDTIMTTKQRMEIIRGLRFVDHVVAQKTFEFPDKLKNNKKLCIIDNREHSRDGATVLIPYHEGISSTMYRKVILENPDHR